MLKPLMVLLTTAVFILHGNAQKLNQDYLSYINKYKDHAVSEMERAGIPASIKLAQGLLESGAGKSYLAKKGNNHFGIKCGANWKGKKVWRKDDDYDANGKLIKSCFRSYRSVKACYIAHSEFLRDPKKNFRYGFLFRLDPTDYKRWAKGLKKAGYATSATYHTKLIRLIEQYELHKYDTYSSGTADTDIADVLETGIFSINDVKYTNAETNETLADIAKRTDVALRSLLRYNEQVNDGNQTLKEGERVYIQPKRNSTRGRNDKWHTTKAGENLFSISQQYGVKLSKLMRRNRLETGMEPAIGAKIKMRGCKVSSKKRPTLATAAEIRVAKQILKEKEEKAKKTATQKTIKKAKATKDSIDLTKPTSPLEDTAKPDSTQINKTPVVIKSEPFPTGDIPEIPTEKEETLPEITPQGQDEPKATEGQTSIPDFSTEETIKEEIPVTETPADTASKVYHTVEAGDTLWKISKKYKVSVDSIKNLNNLKDNNIRMGQKLRIK